MTLTDREIDWTDDSIRMSRLGCVQDHADEDDIGRLVELAGPTPTDVVVDMVTGLGHVARAIAPLVKRVDAIDPDPKILVASETITNDFGISNINFSAGRPVNLELEENTYDIYTARLALRHFKDKDSRLFLSEAHRILKPEGRLVLVDMLAPLHSDLVGFQVDLMTCRDPSHVRSYDLAELEILLEKANFDTDCIEIFPMENDFQRWATRLDGGDERARMLEKILMGATGRVKRHFRIKQTKTKIVSFVTWMILLRARPYFPG